MHKDETPERGSGIDDAADESKTGELTMTLAAQHAIRAAKSRTLWGAWAARRYAIKRGVLPLYRLACQLEAAA
jgi:hypothetical protein